MKTYTREEVTILHQILSENGFRHWSRVLALASLTTPDPWESFYNEFDMAVEGSPHPNTLEEMTELPLEELPLHINDGSYDDDDEDTFRLDLRAMLARWRLKIGK